MATLNETISLVTLDGFKEMMGITSSSKDNTYINYINVSSAIIKMYCRRNFKSATETEETYDGHNGRVLNLKRYPVTTFTKLEVRYDFGASEDWEEVDSDLYSVDLVRGQIIMNGRLFDSKYKYRVTYTGGYSSVPEDIQFACSKLALDLYNNRNKAGNISSERLRDYSVSLRDTGLVSTDIKLILDAYKTYYV